MIKKSFYVVCVISNPVRYKTRYALYREFEKRMAHAGVKLLTVECSFGTRRFQITERGNPMHVQVTTYDELWHKENMLNIGFSHLPKHWKYAAWIDADVHFLRPDWVLETYHQLQHHYIVQMFQTAIDLGPTGESFGLYQGFAWAYRTGRFTPKTHKYTSFHPGYAWAIRREAFDALGGLLDTPILGAADRHMAYGMTGVMQESIQKGLDPSYKTALLEWEARAERYIQRDIGYVPGSLVHFWHGKKVDRKYHDRWKILIRNQYNPYTDLKKDSQGLYQLEVRTPRQIQLRDDLRDYFRSRNEDSIDLE